MSNENIEKSSMGKPPKKSWRDIPYKRLIELTIALVTLITIAAQLASDGDPMWTDAVTSLSNKQEFYLRLIGVLLFMLTSYVTIVFVVDWHLPTTLFLKFMRYIINSVTANKIGIIVAILAGFYASHLYENEDNITHEIYDKWAYWGILVAFAVLTVYHGIIPWINKIAKKCSSIEKFMGGLEKHKEEPIYNFMALFFVIPSFGISKFILDKWVRSNIGENYIIFVYILLFIICGLIMFLVFLVLLILCKFIFKKIKEMWINRKKKKS